jgi:toxin-antitoxin system PIN domain toxin
VTWLADGNVLAALLLRTHVHHERAHRWFAGLKKDRFATCPTTQGTLLRVHMRLSVEGSAAAAWEALRAVSAHPVHEWWDDSLDYLDVPHRHLQGYKQVTDAWLAELARRRGGCVATLDSAFATLHADAAVLLPILEGG